MLELLPKSISGLLVAVMIANLVLFAGIMYPKPAQAVLGVGDITFNPVDYAFQGLKWVWEKAQVVWERAVALNTGQYQTWDQLKSNHGIIAEIVASLLLVTMHVALGKITNDIVAWINGGGKGKIRVLQDPGKFLADAVDAGGGVLAGAILNVDPRTLCNADFLKLKLRVAFTGPYAVPTFDEKVACTFSGMAEGLRKFQQDFNEGGWTAFIKYSEKSNNRIGQTLITAEEMQNIKAAKSAESTAELGISKGFLSQKKCVITRGITSDPSAHIGKTPEEILAGQYYHNYGGGEQIVECTNPDGTVVPPGPLADPNATCVRTGTTRGNFQATQGGGDITNIEEFKGWWIANGGKIDCKIVTPAEQISELTSNALLAPIKRLEGTITGMTEKLGTGAGSIIKPYVLAIASAALNQLLLKEKGLVSAAFTRPQKPRKSQRQFSGSLQENAVLGQSATALTGSVSDFRSFLLKALLDFNIFITATADTILLADRALGRTSINEPNWDATSCPPAITESTDPATLTNSCYNDTPTNLYTSGQNGPGWPPGWPSEYGLGDPGLPYSVIYNDLDGKLAWGQPVITTNPLNPNPNIYTNAPGKVFHEEAAWCGAYFQQVPVADTNGNPIIERTPVTLAGFFRSQSNSTPQGQGARISQGYIDCPPGEYMSGTINGTGDLSSTGIYCSPVPPFLTFDNSTTAEYGGLMTSYNSTPTSTGTSPYPVPPYTTTLIPDCGAGGVDACNVTKCPDGYYMTGISRDRRGDTDYVGIRCALAPTSAELIANSPTGIPFPSTSNSVQRGGLDNGANVRVCPDGEYASGIMRGTDGAWDFLTVYCSPVNVTASGTAFVGTMWEKYFSPSFEGGTVSLLNKQEGFDFPSLNIDYLTPLDSSDAILMRGNFYPELLEKMQELMEKTRIIEGYHFGYSAADKNKKDYLSPLADQLGATPDDDPLDNDPKSANYATYKGSVTDVLTKYNDLNQIYQALFAGLQDENSLEGVDKNLTILSPEESNIRLALIGERCPAIPPSATSTPWLVEKCPVLSSGEYNMARKFVFERDTVGGITTGFATNPFTGEKSSSLAGFLNLEEMTTQLGSLPPNKNIVKLVRARQLLEQLQALNGQRPLPVPGKLNTFLNPGPLTRVDVVRVSIPGYEHIQTWLNDTTTRNKDIQELISAYGYTTAEEAYPQISQELDDVLDEIVNQITDKLKDVFLKRTELALEEARVNARERLRYFVEYIRDLNSIVKLELTTQRRDAVTGNPADTLLLEPFVNDVGHGSSLKKFDQETYVLGIDAKALFDTDQTAINNLIGNNNLTIAGQLNDNEKRGLIGSAIYKIKTLARFVGIDTGTINFASRIGAYSQIDTSNPDDLNNRVKNVLRDVYTYYAGIFDPLVAASTACAGDLPCAELSDNTPVNQSVIYKDARMKLEELNNDFNLMLDEISGIKQEFQDLISNVDQEKQGIEDTQALLGKMLDDYNDANACFGFSTDDSALWQLSAVQKASYSRLGAAIYGSVSALALAGTGAYIGSLFGPIGGIVGGVAGALTGFTVGPFINRKKKKKARAAAERARQKALENCATGIDNYNRHLGQLVDNFVCGKINKKYEDR